jgi:hypothetical protein
LDFKVPESFLFASKFGRGIPKFGLFVSMIWFLRCPAVQFRI